jgi:hypothetical protein
MKADIEAAVYDAQTRMLLLFIHSGQDKIDEVVQRDFDDLLNEMNDPVDTVAFKVLSQAEVHGVITKGTKGTPINLEVALSEWGQVKEPFYAIYGYVTLKDVANWWNTNYPRIVAPNLRMFLGQTAVNEGILDTIKATPEHFWYFNNGVTVLCASISKKPIGGNSREMGYFECNDVSIVNGAQTVGSIASAAATQPDKVENAKVLIRFISLKDTPGQFASNITQFTNTQNRIERRDFVALDPEQQRLRTELQIDGIEYVYKSGDAVSAGRTGFDLTEASVSLACAHNDLSYAVQTKREIGKLWEDISKPPYKALFNPSLNGPKLWHLAQILRIADAQLANEQRTRSGRNMLFAVHGNRMVAWLVMQIYKDVSSVVAADIQATTISALDRMIEKADELYPDSYLATMFKNLRKCRAIISALAT